VKVTSIALGVLASTATLAVPTVSTAGVRVDVGVLLGAPAYSDRDGYDRGYRGDAGRYGYERGYREGTSEGYKDGRKGRRFDFRRDGDYRDADDGYKGWMGPRHVYERGFRRGFEEGYRRAFDAGRRERRDDRRHDRDWDRRDRDDRDRW
jgi:hypothetical protein